MVMQEKKRESLSMIKAGQIVADSGKIICADSKWWKYVIVKYNKEKFMGFVLL